MAISNRTSFSSTSTQTIIEPEQQQQQQQEARSNSHDNIEPLQRQHTERGEGRRRSEAEDEDEEHERRLRLIEVNRTRTRLIEEEQELSPAGSSPPTAVVLSNDCQPSKEPLIPLEIILSPINQKKAFHFDHLLTIAQLTSHLLNDWPADWAQPGSTVPHHANQFRMVYMGRFLDEQETLNSLGKNRPIIIHLVIKPDESAAEEEEVDEEKTRLCGCFGGLRARSPGACSIV